MQKIRLGKVFQSLAIVVCLIWQAGYIFPQSKPFELGKKYSVSELKADFNVFRENLERLHIGLYSYATKSVLDEQLDQIESAFDKPMTALELFNRLRHINKFIGNAHTTIAPPKAIWDGVKTNLPIFPFEVYWDDDSLFVRKNLSKDQSIEDGSEIEMINGRSVKEIFREMKELIRRDGYNKSYPSKRASYSFSLIYAVQFGMPDTFEIRLKPLSGKVKLAKVEPLGTDKLNENHLVKYKKPRIEWGNTKDRALNLSIDGDIATMTVRSFQIDLIKKKGQKWKKFFKRSFKEVNKKGINHLIIDLRDNNGGQPEPTIELLRYLHNKPFTIYKSITAKVDKIPKKSYFLRDGSIESFANINWKKSGEVFSLNDRGEFEIHKPAKTRYRGELYVLINAFTNSATGTFAGQLRSLTSAVFIGDETGGNPNQTVARQIVKMELPNSKVRVSIPLVLSIKNVNFKNQGRGVIPDHTIIPTIRDVLIGKDVVMDFTNRLIKTSAAEKE